jgi:hypothetical protein
MSVDLGRFAEPFASWQRVFAGLEKVEQRWDLIDSFANEVAGFIVHGLDKAAAVDRFQITVEAFGLVELYGNDEVQQILVRALERREEEVEQVPDLGGNGHDQDAPLANLLPLMRPFPIDEGSIPPRAWVVPGLLMRKQVTVLVAPSGTGKSLLTLQVGIACALNLPWCGWRPRGTSRVLMINSEDDFDEIRRRLAAAVFRMKYPDGRDINQTQLAERFFVAENPTNIVVAKFDNRTKTMVRQPLLDQLIDTIIANQIDVIIVDPFAETFEGDENSNSELKWAGVLWREVARRTDAALCLVHHTKKYATGMAGDVDAARGAGALIGIARIVSTLFTMTKQEAEANDVPDEERINILRYDDAKANLNLVSPVAKWFRKDTVTLENATAELPGDQVGTLLPWKPKGLEEGILQAQIIAFFERVDRGILDKDGQPSGEFYTFASRKDSEWDMSRYVGDLIEQVFGVKTKKAAELLNLWRKKGDLIEGPKYRSPKSRKERARCVSRLFGQKGKGETGVEPALFG